GGDGGRAHLLVDAAAEVGGEHDEHRAQPLAARVHEVTRRRLHERVRVRRGIGQPPLDVVELAEHELLETGVAEIQGRGHSKNLDACAVIARIALGTTPSRTVPTAHTTTATAVRPSVRTTVVDEPSSATGGSVKNIRTMIRT